MKHETSDREIEFDREVIYLKTAKGDKKRVVFLHKKINRNVQTEVRCLSG
jgi:hypothetical protein